jgi:hypothetical protein
MRRHGLIWPFNAHFHVPLIAQAPGGCLISGFGGDEIGSSSATVRAEQAFTGRRRPHPVDVAVVGFALAPDFVRRAVLRKRNGREYERLAWLTAEGKQAVVEEVGAHEAAMPFGWSRILRTYVARGRYFELVRCAFELLGEPTDTQVVHPFVADPVLQALARQGGVGGLGTRTDIMRLLFGDLLPTQILERRSKAAFTDPLWTPTAFEFAKSWSGRGLEAATAGLVDFERLREHWLTGAPDLLSTSLLQRAWLADHGVN